MHKNFKLWLEETYGDDCFLEATNDEEIYKMYYEEFMDTEWYRGDD